MITLTNSPERPNPFGERVRACRSLRRSAPPGGIAARGRGALQHLLGALQPPAFSHAQAVDNTRALFAAARQAGVRRVVHVSITNPSEDSPLEYFRGKARLERALIGVRALLRHPPAGGALRQGRHPDQQHRLGAAAAARVRRLRRRPVSLAADLRRRPGASWPVEQGTAGEDNRIIDAIGPETFTYRDLVMQIGAIIGKPAADRCGAAVGGLSGRPGHLGRLMGDVMITREEIGA